MVGPLTETSYSVTSNKNTFFLFHWDANGQIKDSCLTTTSTIADFQNMQVFALKPFLVKTLSRGSCACLKSKDCCKSAQATTESQ